MVGHHVYVQHDEQVQCRVQGAGWCEGALT